MIEKEAARLLRRFADAAGGLNGGPADNDRWFDSWEELRALERDARRLLGSQATACNCGNHAKSDWRSPHSLTCPQYEAPPSDPAFAKFGSAVWSYIVGIGGDFCGEEISEDILPLAEAAGLCQRVEFDPAVHGEDIDADPGSEIWYWGASR